MNILKYIIYSKNLAEIQKINYSTNNSIYYLNFLEISSTEFLLNKGDKEHEREKYRTYKREDKKVENVLTKVFTLDKNKRFIDKEIPNFPFGKILKFKDTFILIQTYFDPNYSGRHIIHKEIYLNLNNNYIQIMYINPSDSIIFPKFEVFNEDLFLFYNKGIHKYFIDINNLKNYKSNTMYKKCIIDIKNLENVKGNIIYLNFNTLIRDYKKLYINYFHYFNEKDNTLNLFLGNKPTNLLYFKLNKELKVIGTQEINFTNRYKTIKYIRKDQIILINEDNSYNFKAKNGIYFYEKINENYLLDDIIKNNK